MLSRQRSRARAACDHNCPCEKRASTKLGSHVRSYTRSYSRSSYEDSFRARIDKDFKGQCLGRNKSVDVKTDLLEDKASTDKTSLFVRESIMRAHQKKAEQSSEGEIMLEVEDLENGSYV